jgi:hypothetical protein
MATFIFILKVKLFYINYSHDQKREIHCEVGTPLAHCTGHTDTHPSPTANMSMED